MNLSDIAKRASKFAIDNSPTLLTTIGAVGAVTTAYLAGRASFEAADIIRLQEGSEFVEADLREPREVLIDRTKLVWKLYIPAISTGAITLVCIIGANHISHRRAAGMAAAYTIVEKAGHEYQQKVVETLGERKEEKLRDEIIQDRISQHGWEDDSIEIHGKPQGEPFYDKFSDRYVWSTQEDIRAAVNSLNQAIINIGYATAADFYYLMDMPAPSWSQEIGWNSNDELMQPRFSSHLTTTGQPVHAFEFDAEPTRNYQRFH